MPIIIENISIHAHAEGINQYRLRINEKLIVEFEHDRSYNGLSQCLRDAAEAVDALGYRDGDREYLSYEEMMEIIEKLKVSREKYQWLGH